MIPYALCRRQDSNLRTRYSTRSCIRPASVCKCLPWDTSLRGAGSPVLCMSATCETVTLVVLRLKAHWFRPTTALPQACRTEPNHHGPDSNRLLPGLSSRRLCHRTSVAYFPCGRRRTDRRTGDRKGSGRLKEYPPISHCNTSQWLFKANF